MIILLWIFILNLIILFGAEFSKVYASTVGPHPHLHSPATLEKIIKTLENAEETIEEATKGNNIETPEEMVEKLKAESKSKKIKS